MFYLFYLRHRLSFGYCSLKITPPTSKNIKNICFFLEGLTLNFFGDGNPGVFHFVDVPSFPAHKDLSCSIDCDDPMKTFPTFLPKTYSQSPAAFHSLPPLIIGQHFEDPSFTNPSDIKFVVYNVMHRADAAITLPQISPIDTKKFRNFHSVT